MCRNRAATRVNLLKRCERRQDKNTAICRSFAISRNPQQPIALPSHGRGRWFEPSIAHSGRPIPKRKTQTPISSSGAWCSHCAATRPRETKTGRSEAQGTDPSPGGRGPRRADLLRVRGGSLLRHAQEQRGTRQGRLLLRQHRPLEALGGHGYIIFGVSNRGRVVGIANSAGDPSSPTRRDGGIGLLA